MIAPILVKVAEEKQGKLKVVKLNADEHPDIMEELNVQALPTLIGFKDGAAVSKRIVGLVSHPALSDFIRDHLSQ
jgi:thioredoxin-like negative regulator of GroEL